MRKSNGLPWSGFAQITAAPGGKLWGIDLQARLLRQEGAQWLDSGISARAVAAGALQEVWAIDLEGRLGRYNTAQRNWQVVSTPSPVQAMSIDSRNEPWVIDAAGLVHQRLGERWQAVPGIEASSIAVGPLGAVYASTASLQLFWLDRATLEWKPASGTAKSVAVGPGDRPWVIDEQNSLLVAVGRDRPDERPILLPGAIPPQAPPALITIAPPAASGLPTLNKPLVYASAGSGFRDVGIGADGTVFAAGAGGGLFCFANANHRFQMAAAGAVNRIAVSPSGNPWVINAFGQLSFFEKGGWQVVPGIAAQDVSISADGSVFVAQADRAAVYSFNVVSRAVTEVLQYSAGIPLRAKRIAAGSNSLWAITPANQVLQCSGNACRLKNISAADIAVGPEGSVFALDLNGSLQRYNARTDTFLKVNGQGNSLAVGQQGLPWLVSPSGEIQYAGLFATSSKSINSRNCGEKFAVTPVPQIPNPVAVLIARDDALALNPGASASILSNDSLNGRVPNFNQVRVTLSSGSAALRYDRGLIALSSNASPGSTLTASYVICAEPGAVPCARAAISVLVVGTPSADISATPDSAVLAPSGTLNLLTNDSLNGAVPTSAQVNVNFVSQSPQLTQAGGLLSLSASATPGTSYAATYRICVAPSGTPCSSTVSVIINVPATISSVPDNAALAPSGTLNLLANDSLNGAVPTSAQVNVNFASQSPQLTQVGGLLTLNAAATAGSSHTSSYNICAAAANTLCSSTVNVIINVPAAISAIADSATLAPGGTLNLLANDNLNGAVPTSAQVNVSFASQSAQLTQVGGLLTLNAAAAAGSSHTASYQICAALAGTPCSSTVTVIISVPAAISAAPDSATLAAGGTLNLLANDNLNGAVPTSAQVNVSFASQSAQLTQVGGLLTLNAGAAAGSSHTASYSICAAAANTLCSNTATVIINVPAVISAATDSAALSAGGTLNLLANDNINGAVPASGQVNVRFVSQSPQLTQVGGLLTLNAAALAGSSHTASYSICAAPAGTPCSSTVTVIITVPVIIIPPAITAAADSSTLSAGGTLNLLANDNLNGAVPTSAQVNVSFASQSAQLTQVGGLLTLNAAAAAGSSHTASYQICAAPAGTPCSSTVTVIINVPATISAIADSATLAPGGTLNLLANDNLNGAVPTSAQVNASFASQSPQLIQVGGLLTLNAAALAGSSHTATYRICAAPSGTPCSSTVTVIINVPASISATADSATLAAGGTLNLLANDNLNGSAPSSGQVNVNFASQSAQLTQVGGLLTLNAGAAAGSGHTASYSICAAPAGTPCSNTVTVVINVPVTAVAVADIVPNFPRGAGFGFGLHNDDTLNGVLVPPGAPDVQYTLNNNTAIFMLSIEGYLELVDDVSTPLGTYNLSYTFCELGVPTNCSNATAQITVTNN
jgi:hypothetical protein